MKIWHLKIKSETPIILNVRKRESDIEKSKLTKDELEEWELNKKNWSRKAELNKQDEVVVPARWFMCALEEVCKRTRMVPHFATRKTETYTNYVQIFTVISNGKPLCKRKDLQPYEAYTNKTPNTKKRSMIWTIRPMVENWSAEFDIIDPMGRMKKEELKQLITYMGLYVRIGDNRKHNFGAFSLTSLTLIKEKGQFKC